MRISYFKEVKHAMKHKVIPNYHWQYLNTVKMNKKTLAAELKEYKKMKRKYGEFYAVNHAYGIEMIKMLEAASCGYEATRPQFDALDDMVDSIVMDTEKITMRYFGFHDKTTVFTVDGTDIMVGIECDVDLKNLVQRSSWLKTWVATKSPMEIDVVCRLASDLKEENPNVPEPLMTMEYDADHNTPETVRIKYPREFRSTSDEEMLHLIQDHIKKHVAKYAVQLRLVKGDEQ